MTTRKDRAKHKHYIGNYAETIIRVCAKDCPVVVFCKRFATKSDLYDNGIMVELPYSTTGDWPKGKILFAEFYQLGRILTKEEALKIIFEDCL